MTAVMAAAEPGSAAPGDPRRRRAHVAAGALAAVLVVAVAGWSFWPAAPGSTAAHTGTPHYVVAATLDRPRVGTTDVELALTARDRGTAALTIQDVQMQAIMPLTGYATEPVTAAPAADAVPGAAGRYRAVGLPLMMTGPWQLLATITFPGGTDHLTVPFWVSG
jgi:hypothetical protein